MEIILKVREGIHKKPSFFNKKTFQKVIQCEDCKFTISEDEGYFYQPCPNCGGRFCGSLSFTGIWKDNAWIERVGVKN